MLDEQQHRINTLASKLCVLKKRDWRLKVFGAYSHAYRTNGVLQESYIAGIETQYDISLPCDYRNWLIYVSSGGVGPCYGIIPLQNAFLDSPRYLSSEFLSAPFPHTTEFNPYRKENSEDENFDSVNIRGSIPISHRGCGLTYRLIISGPQRGAIWQDLRADDGGLVPTGLNFYEWVDDWLNNSLALVQSGLFSRLAAFAYRTCGPSEPY